MDRDHAQRFEHPGAERHVPPGVPAPAHRERVRVQQVRVADAVVSGITHVVCDA
jgi:hypothetical protein